ncbi:flagellar hook-length control protein FliK [Arsukibacterium indicum]|uniref:Flagellar hook-length control protein FliK n=1 Tax=Arsukibacterium indicum TaxID=2848612 RepID=A0ABS6MGB2_9GAMM|nr:flagellar hook-length control protein FliK [Arsukibacterium indicum]MBV2127852.1 flagellar hook-length control protein FliK [Arsukibacterium indicum]
MNPLLSLSFSSSGPVSAGVDPVLSDSDGLLDESSGAKQFSDMLDQSGQQQSAGRQSIAGFSIGIKGKRMASMEGQPLNRPQDAIPPVIAPQAELLLINDNDAGTLLGFLDLASQTRLQLTTELADKTASKAAIQPEASASDQSENIDGKKINSGDWFILPVYPEAEAAGITVAAIPEDAAKHSETNATATISEALSAGQSNGKTVAESVSKNAVHNAEQHLSQADVAAGAIVAGSADKAKQQSAASAPDVLAQQILASHDNANGEKSAQDNAEVIAETDADNLAVQTTGQAPDTFTSAVLTSTGLSGQQNVSAQTQAETVANTTEAEVIGQLNAAQRALSAETKPVTTDKTSSETKILQPAAATSLRSAQTEAVTIFADTDKTAATADDAKPGSALASAAMVAESLSAKQQQRSGATDSFNQPKQTSVAETDSGAAVPGSRTDTSLNSFSSAFSQGGQSQTEAAIARMDAAMVSANRQSATQTAAPAGNKSVAEQLKHVNLLAENAAGQLKERLNVMVRQNIHVAEIRLDPAELGQMQIRVNLQQEQASVQFIVQQQHAKELLEQQMPRLREMLQQQGIQLGEGQVQQQRQGDSQASSRRDGNSGNAQGGNEQPADDKATAVQLEVKLSERIVDYYA